MLAPPPPLPPPRPAPTLPTDPREGGLHPAGRRGGACHEAGGRVAGGRARPAPRGGPGLPPVRRRGRHRHQALRRADGRGVRHLPPPRQGGQEGAALQGVAPGRRMRGRRPARQGLHPEGGPHQHAVEPGYRPLHPAPPALLRRGLARLRRAPGPADPGLQGRRGSRAVAGRLHGRRGRPTARGRSCHAVHPAHGGALHQRHRSGAGQRRLSAPRAGILHLPDPPALLTMHAPLSLWPSQCNVMQVWLPVHPGFRATLLR